MVSRPAIRNQPSGRRGVSGNHVCQGRCSLGGTFTFGANPSFGNAGMYQNQWEYATTLRWVKGRHSLSFGANLDQTQLNIINNNTNSDIIAFSSFTNFLEGVVRTGTNSTCVYRIRRPLLPVQYRGSLRQRQLEGTEQPDGDAGLALGL
jgi:hypothetical protein